MKEQITKQTSKTPESKGSEGKGHGQPCLQMVASLEGQFQNSLRGQSLEGHFREVRCVYCRGTDKEGIKACPRCMTLLHVECWHHQITCPSLGCNFKASTPNSRAASKVLVEAAQAPVFLRFLGMNRFEGLLFMTLLPLICWVVSLPFAIAALRVFETSIVMALSGEPTVSLVRAGNLWLIGSWYLVFIFWRGFKVSAETEVWLERQKRSPAC